MATVPAISVTARAADARVELLRLRADVRAWLTRRRDADPLEIFKTPLDALETALETAIAGVTAAAPAAGPTTLAGIEACRRVERGTVWLRRVWTFFRWRFDQRDPPDSPTARLLRAADELVWSCYRPAFGDGAVPTPPLAYVEEHFTPFAMPRDTRPPDLTAYADADFLADYLSRLPIPVLGLPPASVEHPWWLVFVAHEVGHHVHYDLQPAGALVGGFETWLAAALSDPQKRGVAARWAPWGREIFADAWSVLTVGPAALWALVALEAGDERRLLQTHKTYPSTYVRVALMAGLLDALGLEPGPALRGLDPKEACDGDPLIVEGIDRRAQLKADLAVVPTLVAALATRSLPAARPLPALAGWTATDFTAAASGARKWTKAFAAADAPAGVPTRDAPRLAVAGAIWAWAALDDLPEAARDAERQALRDRVVSAVGDSHEESVRGAEPEPAVVADLGTRLTALVLGAPEPVPDQP